MRFEYDAPTPIAIIADGSSLAVRDRKLATQDIYPLSQTPLRFLLSDRIDLMKDTNVVSVTADDLFISVTIEEKQALIGTSRLMLMVGAKDGQLKQWTVTDPQGYDTTVAVYNLDTSKKVDPGLFKIDDFTRFYARLKIILDRGAATCVIRRALSSPCRVFMRFSLTTWNINSVRLRIDLVAKFLKSARPDVLCLQETKCIDDAFPLKRFRRLGYEHVALNGQKGYHGVAVISKLPFETTNIRTFCDKIDSRHISVEFGDKAQLSKPLVLHNFYVPAGGDIPDPALNPKFEHKLQFLDEMKACEPLHPRGDDRHILVGDLNVAPHENDVWSHKQLLKVVSHTPIECEKLLAAQAHGEWVDVARSAFRCRKKSIPGGATAPPTGPLADRGRRLDHIWVSRALQESVSDFRITRDARGWERPSDHVPVTVTLEV